MNRPEYNYRSSADRKDHKGADWHWLDYAAVLLDRIWIAIIVLVLVTATGVYRTWKETPLYRSSARIMIEENMDISIVLSVISTSQNVLSLRPWRIGIATVIIP